MSKAFKAFTTGSSYWSLCQMCSMKVASSPSNVMASIALILNFWLDPSRKCLHSSRACIIASISLSWIWWFCSILEKLFDIKPIGWNNSSSCCCDRMAPMVKLDASHPRQKRPDLEGKVSMGVEVMVFFNALKACCSAAPHDQSFDFQVSTWRGQVISEKFQMNLQ